MSLTATQINQRKKQINQAIASRMIDIWTNSARKRDAIKAIASDILLPFIQKDVWAKNIVDAVFEKVPDEIGNLPWPTDPEHTVYFVDEHGQFIPSIDQPVLAYPTGYDVKGEAVVWRNDLRRGHVASLMVQRQQAEKKIVIGLNQKAIGLLRVGADASMTINSAGSLTTTAVDTGINLLNDRGLTPRLILGRATTLGALPQDTNVGDALKSMYQEKGIQNIGYGGANFMYTPDSNTNEVYILCDEKPGRHFDEFPLEVDEVELKTKGQIVILLQQTKKMATTNPLRFVKINIT